MQLKILVILALAALGFRSTLNAYGQSEDGLARAGCPHQIARYARVGYGKKYIVYYVGGGARTPKGELRNCHEGTFGVDSMPIVPGFHRAVDLGWWHGQRVQGGPGQYEPNIKVAPFPSVPRRSVAGRLAID